ncbi:MAG: nitroreductase family deazaflavin-dependent oxidoreductase [Actinomycetota bacterium]|nr:nitroreductase family deazaflavin-dependent oxidoreductase [Actinomycetota bacterium]
MDLGALADEDYCYLTTRGRVTGRAHEIEIWFALEGSTLYILSGGGDRTDWVRNIWRNPETTVRIGDSTFAGRGRLVDETGEDELARKLLFEKYQPRFGGDLTRWRGYALSVAVDLDGPAEEIRSR